MNENYGWGGTAHLVGCCVCMCCVYLEEPVRVASPTRINLEEPVRVASPTTINLEEPIRVASPTRINLFSVCPSFCLSVRAKRGIE